MAQALLFVVAALRDPANEAPRPRWSAVLGATLLVYALVVYPWVGQFSGHPYPRTPTFGLPCPTTIFTFGLLVLLPRPPAWWLLVIPLLWAAVGSSAPFAFGIWEDLGLPIAGVLGLVGVVLLRSRTHGRPATHPR